MCWETMAFIIILIFMITNAQGKINDASELDCSFEFPCRWFNGTNGLEDTIDWNTALAVTLGNWNNLPILGFSKNASMHQHAILCHAKSQHPNFPAGNCLSEQMKTSRSSKIAFSADCAESQSLTFMATTKSENDVYSYAIGSAGSTAWLVSAEIPKQIGAGILSFSYWKSKNPPSLRICGRKPPGYPNGLDCNWYNGNNQYQGQTWVQDRVIIPPSDVPFEIVIAAQFTEINSFVAIDDLQYRASVGTNGNTINFANSPFSDPNRHTNDDQSIIPSGSDVIPLGSSNSDSVPKKPAPEDRQTPAVSKVIGAKLQVIIDTSKCPQVACDFDRSFCQYANLPSGGNWKRQNQGRVGSAAVGIPSDFNGNGGYAYALQQLQTNSTFILSTPPFVTSLTGVLTFHYYQTSHTSRLQLCEPTLDNCTVIANGAEPSQIGWQSIEIPLPAGRHQLFFIADRMDHSFITGLDNVQIWDKTKTFELECSRS